MKRTLSLALCLLFCATVISACAEGGGLASGFMKKEQTYQTAKSLLDQGDLQGAYDAFLTIKDYSDVPEYLGRFVYRSELFTSSSDGTEIRYTYDAYGRILKTEQSDRTQYSEFPLTWVYEYNEQGLVRSASYLCQDGTQSVYRYEYDKTGNLIMVINPQGTSSMEFIYDKQGNCTQEIYRDDKGAVLYHTVRQYNQQGDAISITVTDQLLGEEKVTSYTMQYEYDNNGNKTRCIADWKTEEWEYDEQGRVTRHYLEYSYGGYELQTYKYDTYSNVIEEGRASSDRKETTFVYEREYDANGNLLHVEIYYDGQKVRTDDYSQYKLYYDPCGVCEIPEWTLGSP